MLLVMVATTRRTGTGISNVFDMDIGVGGVGTVVTGTVTLEEFSKDAFGPAIL